MKYLGKIIDDKDLVTKEYVDDGLGGKANTSHTQTVSTISDLTATATELNYTDGVTSNIQTQLNTKAPIASPTFTGTVTGTQLISNVASGTPPLVITSPTVVPNLNADKLDGNDASAFALASHTHTVANINGLQTALDNKVDDSQVLTNVPANAVFTDTVYTHPASHPPSIITQDASNRFVTDAERTAWNGKAAGSHTHDDRYLQLTGGTLTGNLTGKYITGTWLQTTSVADLSRAAGKVAVLDDSGWVYYRTVAELLADLGIPGAASIRATTAVYGTTKLSTSITSTSKTTAATPYAVKAALDEAKQYTDTAIGNAIAASY